MQSELRRVLRVPHGSPLPSSTRELASKVFTTCYLATRNSSSETRERARSLASQIGANHLDTDIDAAVSASTAIFSEVYTLGVCLCMLCGYPLGLCVCDGSFQVSRQSSKFTEEVQRRT